MKGAPSRPPSRPQSRPQSRSSGGPADLSGLSREEKLALLRRLAPRAYPLSFAQQRLWFLDQLEPGSHVNTIFRALWLRGGLDAAALGRTVDALAGRHGALRARFPADDDGPRQLVPPPSRGWLRAVDLSALSAAAARELAEALAAAAARLPFDLARGPLFRPLLLRLAGEEHALLLSLHHIVADGWSMGILFRELVALYRAFRAGESPALPAPALEFGDYARWQRQRLQGETLERELAFWRRRLEGAPAVLELAADRPRRALASGAGDIVAVALDPELSAGLKALARREEATLFMLLASLFDLLLFRYTGEVDLVVGLPAANRQRAELEGVIGDFASTLLLRLRLQPGGSFRRLLAAVKAESLAILDHADLPFEKLVEELQPERDLAHNPLFQVMFALQEAGGGGLALPGIEVAPLPVARRLAKLELTLDLTSGPDGVAGYFEYASELFDRTTVERLARHWQALVAAALASPDRPLSRLPMLAPAELHQLRREWNPPRPGEPAEPVHRRFFARAEGDPAAPALLFAGEEISYGELAGQVRQLARHLRTLGVGPEVPVGICLERSPLLPVAVLGVLAAGGAYVPLDPAYPAERLAFLIADSGMPLLLTQESLAAGLPPSAARLLALDVDAGWRQEEDGPLPEPAEAELAERTAYRIYTSGSTGDPKGVTVPHRALANHAAAIAELYRLGPADRVLHFASISFDIAAEELFPTWAAGAALVPRPPGLFPSLAELEELFTAGGITVANLPTQYWHEWAGDLGRSPRPLPAALRLLVVGTEQASPEALGPWRQAAGEQVRFVNAYGPTEGTITATLHRLPAAAPAPASGRVPIGLPIPGAAAHLLDRGLGPVSLGVPGELFLGGAGIARGYHRAPALTASRFLPDPFASLAGGRLYKTGDRCRRLGDGALEFLGRGDEQVKIRGFRVEPGEVEAALGAHPGVEACAVVARREGGRGMRLVAFACPLAGGGLEAGELAAFLRRRLPEYMVPGAFVLLPALPLTASGKIDRRALPAAPEEGAAADSRPATPIEEVIAGLWAEVLERAEIGRGESFFDLGGHSLLAARVISRLRSSLGVELPLRAFFEAPTVARLAAEVERRRRDERGLGALPVVAVGREGDLPTSFAQQRLWFLDQLLPGNPVYNMPAAVRLKGEVRPALLAACLTALVRRHESLRTTLLARGGQPFQRIAPPAAVPLPWVDLSGLDSEAATGTLGAGMVRESLRPFDLGAGPLLRACLFVLPPGDAGEDVVFHCTQHHAITDGESISLFLGELLALYRARAAGEASPLPELSVQYGDFAAWQRQQLAGEVLASLLDYWKRELAGAPVVIELPADRPRPALQTYRGARRYFRLEREAWVALEALGRRHGGSLFMSLLALFDALLGRSSGQGEVVVGWPIAGRHRPELAGMVGYLANILVLRASLAGAPSYLDLLARVRRAALGAYDHQDMPFEQLVEELQPERHLSHNPIFQVFFVLHHLGGGGPELPGVETSLLSIDNRTTRADLSLALTRGRDELAGFFEYSTDLFDAATIDRLTGHFQNLLAAAVESPELPVAGLAMLSGGEREQLLSGWNESAEPYPAGSRVHELFAERAAAGPEREALRLASSRFPGGVAASGLAYGELEIQANRLAQLLRRRGVGPEVPVALLMERSAEMVIALLAVLKAGGGYVPLDPGHPAERLEHALADCGAPLLLTQPHLRYAMDVGEVEVIEVEEDLFNLAGEPAAPPAPAGGPDDLAYVIYTSGSTGRPKGVAVPHRGVVSFLASMAREPGFTATDTLLAVTTIAFDIAGLELFLPLTTGGRVVLADAETAADGALLARALETSQATVMQATPATWRQLLAAGWPGRPGLRVLCGGEALPRELAAALLGRVASLTNVYGPTETTIWSTRQAVGPGDGPVPVGRPIGNTAVYLVDPWLQPVPVGVVGEVLLGGVGVVRGYHRRPGLTAAAFVPDPFAATSPLAELPAAGARLYRTGDLARRLPDGSVVYLRRRDHQVKVRGFRIELGEVEAALGAHPAVAAAVVAVRGETAGDARLVAWWVPRPGAAATLGNLRAALRERLPDYMLPSLFVRLEELPLNPSGKVDRKALPEPAEGQLEAGRTWEPPRGAVEEKLAAIWAEVLRRERIGRGDHFFELGGHSLMATQVLSRVSESFGVELPLRTLFDTPTLAGLAERVVEGELAAADGDLLAELLAGLEGEGRSAPAAGPAGELAALLQDEREEER